MSTIIQNYLRIEKVIASEVERLREEGNDYKADQIDHAIRRLYSAVLAQRPEFQEVPSIYTFGAVVYEEEANNADLSSINAMLDCSLQGWYEGTADSDDQGVRVKGRPEGMATLVTLRESLNIAPYNIFNLLDLFNAHGPTWGPIFGSSTTLDNVVKKLDLS